ncbi:MAG: glycine--tRNA ligase subunit beta [bacterium]
MADDLLLEIGTEELPATCIEPALEQMEALSKKLFSEERIPFKDIKTYGTPRRLILFMREVARKQDDLILEVLGPSKKAAFDSEGNPTKAAIGFAKSQGVEVGDLVARKVEKGEYVFALKRESGRAALKVLIKILKQIISGISFPKSMRWPQSNIRFARPIRWILALYGTKTVNFSLGKLKAGRLTRGHSLLSSKPIMVKNIAEYEELLKNNYVIIDQEKRKKTIEKAISNAIRKIKGRLLEDKELLDEVNYLLEYPTAVVGRFDEKYLKLPPEVLITCLRHHHKYFSLLDGEGRLLPYFVGLRDGISEYMENVREGYQRVLSARLKDAEFFFEQDTKKKLDENVEKLKGVVFQEELGTLYEKTQRIIKLSDIIAGLSNANCKKSTLKRIALLCKADSVTEMVGEFPELQGIMGKEYATISGEEKIVADGIYEHHLPLSGGGELPHSIEGAIVSIADKVDTITGDFCVGFLPSGSQDPYGLRRQAQGVIRIILDKRLNLPLDILINEASGLLRKSAHFTRQRLGKISEIKNQVLQFFRQRLESVLAEAGVKYDEIDATLAVGFSNLVDAELRVLSIHKLRKSPDFEAIIIAFKRARNILKQAEDWKIKVLSSQFNEKELKEAEEKRLFEGSNKIEKETEKFLKKREYQEAVEKLVSLRKPVDDFFDKVMVMVEDRQLRNNRLALLNKIVDLFCKVADFSKIVIE